jgi:hypothetical protein
MLLYSDGALARRLRSSTAMACRANGYVALYRWRIEPTAMLLCNDGARRCRNFCFFYLATSTASFTRKRKRMTNFSMRKREREKESQKKKKKKI